MRRRPRTRSAPTGAPEWCSTCSATTPGRFLPANARRSPSVGAMTGQLAPPLPTRPVRAHSRHADPSSLNRVDEAAPDDAKPAKYLPLRAVRGCYRALRRPLDPVQDHRRGRTRQRRTTSDLRRSLATDALAAGRHTASPRTAAAPPAAPAWAPVAAFVPRPFHLSGRGRTPEVAAAPRSAAARPPASAASGRGRKLGESGRGGAPIRRSTATITSAAIRLRARRLWWRF